MEVFYWKLTYICNTCNIDKFKISNINVSKQLNQCIQPDETNCRKAKENPSNNFDITSVSRNL